MKSILDKNFKYTNSAETDIRKTFARVRRERKVAAGIQSEKQVVSLHRVVVATSPITKKQVGK